jgi:hypothetical protein
MDLEIFRSCAGLENDLAPNARDLRYKSLVLNMTEAPTLLAQSAAETERDVHKRENAKPLLWRRVRSSLVRTSAFMVLICVGSSPVLAGQMRTGNVLSNLINGNHNPRPPGSIPNHGGSGQVPRSHITPHGVPHVAVSAKPRPEQDSQTAPAVISLSAGAKDNNTAPAKPGAITFPPVTPLE